MNKKYKIFLSIDYEIYDFLGLIEQLLKNKNKVIVSYSVKSKEGDFKARDAKKIFDRLSLNKKFYHTHHEIYRNPLTETFRKINTYYEYLSRDQKDFSKLKLRIVETSIILKILENKQSLFNNIFFSKLVKLCNSFLEKVTYSKNLVKFLTLVKPDVVIFNQLLRQINVTQNEIIKACDFLKIPSCYIVKSWDNLTNKAFMNLHPDHIFVWNSYQKKELRKFHYISNSEIHIVGASLYEHLLEPISIRNKVEYYKYLGLDPEKKTVTYFGSSPQIIKNDFHYFSFVVSKLKTTDFFDNYNLIYRSHPLNSQFKNLKKNIDNKLFVAYPNPENFDNIILDKKLYLEAIINSDFILGVNTSAIVESAFYLKPLILLNIQENEEDAGLFLETYHSRYLTSDNSGVGVGMVANNENELISSLSKLSVDQNYETAIKKFKKEFINFSSKDNPTNQIIKILNARLEKKFKSSNYLIPNELFTISTTKVKGSINKFKKIGSKSKKNKLLKKPFRIIRKLKKYLLSKKHKLSKIPLRIIRKLKKYLLSKKHKLSKIPLRIIRKLKKYLLSKKHKLSKIPFRIVRRFKNIY